MLRKMLAIAAIGAAVVLAAPAAAQAAGYTAQGPSVSEQVGDSVTLGFTGFPPNTPATATADDAVTLSVLRASTFTRPTNDAGAVTFTAKATIPGTYTITVEAGGVIGVGTLTVLPDDSTTGGGVGGTGDVGGPGGLPGTGFDLPVLWIWIGSGAVVLGAAFVIVLARARRSRDDA